VERVEADPRLRYLLSGDGQVDAAAVEADRLDRGGALRAEGGEELFEGGFGALFSDPDDVAGVVVGDDRQELVATLVGNLVDANAVEAVQAGVVDVVEMFRRRQPGSSSTATMAPTIWCLAAWRCWASSEVHWSPPRQSPSYST
jgi:hypothetical protein